ncbi:hypothetical protein BH10ACT11_BH10ACT11_12350 [soil metagenome]
MIGPPSSGLRTLAGLSASGRFEPGQWIGPSAILHSRELADRIAGWRQYTEISQPPDLDFLTRASESGARFESTAAMTAFKFPAVMRPNVYRRRPSHEQAELWRRIRGERMFGLRELARLLRARATEDIEEFDRLTLRHGIDAAKGGWVRESRRIRGLDP